MPVDLGAQLLPEKFAHAKDWLIEHEPDLATFDAGYNNDVVGASAYAPAVLLKAVLFGYPRGLDSSRAIEGAQQTTT